MKLREYILSLDSERIIVTKAVKLHLDDEIDMERTIFPPDLNQNSNIMYLKGLDDALIIAANKGKPCFISFVAPSFLNKHPELLCSYER